MKVKNFNHNSREKSWCSKKDKKPVNTRERLEGHKLWATIINKERRQSTPSLKNYNKEFQFSGITKRTLSREQREEVQWLEANIPQPGSFIPSEDEKALLHVSARLVKDIYSGVNSSGNKELVFTFAPSFFNNTSVKIEKVRKGRIRLVVNTKDSAALKFFNSFYENIRAGLLMKGITIDEFRIG